MNKQMLHSAIGAFLLFAGFTFIAFASESSLKKKDSKPDRWSLSYTLSFKAGHPSASCAGVGELCPGATGFLMPCHIPCWGAGSDCSHTVNITLDLGGAMGNLEVHEATGELVNEPGVPVFMTPAQSMAAVIEGQQVYINFPTQNIVIDNFQDGQSVVYSFTNVTVTNSPLYQVY